jgi:nucleoside-diphosphate-sugar epimerase
MRIFLTGATGYIGAAVLDGFIRAGHEATALVRTTEDARRLTIRGAHAVVGDLTKPQTYRRAADNFDAYVVTAFDGIGHGADIDRQTLDTLLTAAGERARDLPCAFVYTSAMWVLGHSAQPAVEDAPINPTPHVAWRAAHERRVLDASTEGVRPIVVRPGIVYGGSRGIVSDLLKNGVNGLIRVVGSGTNHWPLVYLRDLASLYVKLVSLPEASGIYHANDEGDETVNDLVQGIVDRLSTRPDVRHVPLDEARAKLGAYADALVLDQRVRSPRARALGWRPALHSVAGNVPRLLEEFRGAERRIEH